MMQPLRSLRSTNPLHLPEKRSITQQGRHISRGISTSSWPPSHAKTPLLLRRTQCLCSSHHSTHSKSIDLLNLIPKRFASTKPDIPQNIDAFTADAAPLSNSISDFTSSSFDGITTEIPLQGIGEHLGFLKELGLDFGWGPTAIMETVLESVHLAAGTPWWGSILLTSLLLRVVFLQPVIRASDTSARLATLTPLTDPIRQRMNAAKATQDTEAVKLGALELRQLYKAADIKFSRVILPFVLQGPLGFGSFRLLRNMGTLPVPGLDEGGLLWLKDLTVCDPYFLLPMITGIGLHWTFKKGGETGSGVMMSPMMRNLMLYVIPIFSAGFMMPLPAAVQLSFTATSVLTILQTYYLRQPRVRGFLGIQPMPSPAGPPSESPYKGTITVQASTSSIPQPSPAPKGIIGGAISDIKGAASQVMKAARSLAQPNDEKRGNQRLTVAELKRAHAYEAQRRREIAEDKLEARTSPSQRKKRSVR